MMIKPFLIICFSIIIVSCSPDKKKNIDISNINVSFKVYRFDQEFYHTSTANFYQLKHKYPYLFPKQYSDSVWIKKMKNSDEKKLSSLVDSVYGNFNSEKQQLSTLFKHIKYFYPKFKAPSVITLITDLDYDNSIIYSDSLLFVSLDMYLGKDSFVYQDFPAYLTQNYTKAHLIVDVAKAISKQIVKPVYERVFLNKMIQKGKQLYVINQFLPSLKKSEIIGYTQKQLDWARRNEPFIWKYFIENKLLYNTDIELNKRFLEPAPFSKFYLSIDADSPGRIGAWLGWQIVNSYMEHNNVSLQQLLKNKNQYIFKKSKYKPKK